MLESLFNKVAGLEELLDYAIRLFNLLEIFLIFFSVYYLFICATFSHFFVYQVTVDNIQPVFL